MCERVRAESCIVHQAVQPACCAACLLFEHPRALPIFAPLRPHRSGLQNRALPGNACTHGGGQAYRFEGASLFRIGGKECCERPFEIGMPPRQRGSFLDQISHGPRHSEVVRVHVHIVVGANHVEDALRRRRRPSPSSPSSYSITWAGIHAPEAGLAL